MQTFISPNKFIKKTTLKYINVDIFFIYLVKIVSREAKTTIRDGGSTSYLENLN
jgi:hypothetical protein